jgi:HEAT repeat protein
MYWYEANREEFEDLRGGLTVTEANPLFVVGNVGGRRMSAPERRMDDPTRKRLREAVAAVLGAERDEHWVVTSGAACVALGKVAVDDAQVQPLLALLEPGAEAPAYLRESALMGLGQLRRSEASRRLPGPTLDRVRRALFAVYEASGAAARERGFAAVSLGLLADQPSAAHLGRAATVGRLFRTWWAQDLPDEAQVGVLLALGLQRPDGVPASVRLALHKVVRTGQVLARTFTGTVRAQAAVALGRVGQASDAAAFLALLKDRRERAPATMQGAVLGAGLLGRRHAAVRASLVAALLEAQPSMKDPAARDGTWIALGRILGAAAQDGGATLLARAHVGRRLQDAAAGGLPGQRTHAALGLALALRGAGDLVPGAAWNAWRTAGFEVLRAGLGDRRLDGHARAAYAVAVGIAGDAHAAGALLPIVRSKDVDPDLRARAALALGLLGDADAQVVLAVTDALRDARSDRLRMGAATSLGLLGGGARKDRERSLQVLLAALEATTNKVVKGRIAITLGRLGDARSVAPLVRVLRHKTEQPMNRALACAALGLLGDEERTPVLSAVREDSHYLGGSSVLLDLLDVL